MSLSDVYYGDGTYTNGTDCHKGEGKLLSDEKDCVAVVMHGEYRYRITKVGYNNYLIKADAAFTHEMGGNSL